MHGWGRHSPHVRSPLVSEATRTALFQAGGTDTITTTVFDTALGYPWPAKYPERVLKNQLWQRWFNKESLLTADPEARRVCCGSLNGGPRSVHVNAGQGVGALTGLDSASEFVLTDPGPGSVTAPVMGRCRQLDEGMLQVGGGSA